jgi:DNA-binding HxlR family transcriptional regulator
VYELTGAGSELLPVIVAIGEWGVRWMNALDEADLDPAFLL